MVAHFRQPILNFGNTRKARDYRRELVDPLNHYSKEELSSWYRSWREGINFNVQLLSDEIAPSTKRSHSLSATEQVSVTLHFLASVSFLEVIGDIFLSYDKSTVSRLVRWVTLALASKVNDFVKFPTTPNEQDEIKHGLFGNFFFQNDNWVLSSQHCVKTRSIITIIVSSLCKKLKTSWLCKPCQVTF